MAIQDGDPVAIYRQATDEAGGIMGGTIIEVLGGPKQFARIWDEKPWVVDWGWTLHESAVKIWEPDA